MRSAKFTFVFILFAFTAACGGGGKKVGKQEDLPPKAVASVFGASMKTNGTIDVRSGSEVLLSGQNSDGVDDPLLTFKWEQVDDSGYPVTLYERTSSASVFTAPKIPADASDGVDLEFKLTVTDADGVSNSDTVKVKVNPAYDRNKFLLNPMVDDSYEIFVVPATDPGSEIPVTLEIKYTASWTDRSGVAHSQLLKTDTLSGNVPAQRASNDLDPANLYFVRQVPLLDADEVNKYFQGQNRSGRLELEGVTNASLTIDVSLLQQAQGQLSLKLARKQDSGYVAIDSSTVQSSPTTMQFSSEWLRTQLASESWRSAQNYYDCIDPTRQSATLSGWLQQAGFNDNTSDAHFTVYQNNYDLNFGRAMWVRTDSDGNVYSYVTNYPTLEAALSKRNDFAVVVMEFSPAPTGKCGDGTFEDSAGGKKIVKFYSYVPDRTSGEYVRMNTMNFDGRGERALPGVCLACHYGDTNIDKFNSADLATIPASAADLDSSFIAWDLDNFLYSKAANPDEIDPVYAANPVSDQVTEQFSRSAQEADFRAQNQAALHTFTYDKTKLKRFESGIKLVQGFYGNTAVENLNFGSKDAPLDDAELTTLQAQVDTLPDNSFTGENYVPAGWQGHEDLYHKVYAHYCRLCHVQQSDAALDFDSYQEFIGNANLVRRVFEEGGMPLSRLTMDRFWDDFYGGTSAAELLRKELNSDNDPSNDVPQDLVPGTPVAIVSPGASPDLSYDVGLDFGGSQLFDASGSLFADRYQWRVDGILSGTDSRFNYVADTPGENHEVSLVAYSDDDVQTSFEVLRRVKVANHVPNPTGVPAQSVIEGASIDIPIFSLLCPSAMPDSAACRDVFGDIATGEVPAIAISGTPVNGSIANVDAANGIVTFNSTASEAAGDASFAFTLTDSFGETSAPAPVTISVNSLGGPGIVGPDTCSVSARTFATQSNFPRAFDDSTCADPTLNDTVAGGFNLSLVGVDGSTLNANSSVNLNNGVIEYTPSRFFTGQESFAYTVQDDTLSAKTSVGSVTVTVSPTVTYQQLNSGVGMFVDSVTGCAQCHDGLTAGAPNWQVRDNVLLAATNTNETPYGSPEITLAEPTTTQQLLGSILFRKACNYDGSHVGLNRLCNTTGTPTSVSDLNAMGLQLLEWLEQGAPQ